jgi:sulfhydrogenase subunit delta
MKPKVGIFGLSGCWGEQIVILNCEDELLDVVGAVDIVDFLGGSSVNDEECGLDLALVEGSVGTEHEELMLRKIRERASVLVACGTCACFGGVAASEPERAREEMARAVYGGARYEVRPHRPLRDFVRVDFGVPGCPMEKEEFLRAVACLLNGDVPLMPQVPVCLECKVRETECLLVSRGLPCAGPVTTAGCGARCPGYEVACIGCRGPVEEANLVSLREIFGRKQIEERDVRRRLETFAAPALEQTQGRRS